jgi:hypothetical protein
MISSDANGSKRVAFFNARTPNNRQLHSLQIGKEQVSFCLEMCPIIEHLEIAHPKNNPAIT